MTRRPVTRRMVRPAAVVVAATLALVTAGCGATTEALVGLRDAPPESAAAAPLDPDGAAAVAARLLTASRAVGSGTDRKARAARAAVLAGDALTVADAAAARGGAAGASALAKRAEPTVLAQSQGRQWPRAILATTLDEASTTQYLHVMVSRAPEQPFRLVASVPMFGGAQLPALGSPEAGAPFVDPADGEGLVMTPQRAFVAYANALARPAARKKQPVAAKDPFAAALAASADRQAKALGKLGTLTQRHAPDLEDAVAFRLADGGAVAFGLLRRTDTITVGTGAKELVLPARYARLVGTKKVQESLTLTSLEPVALVVPAHGEVTVIGASEVLVRGKGS